MSLADYIVWAMVGGACSAGVLYGILGDLPRMFYWFSVGILNTATIYFK